MSRIEVRYKCMNPSCIVNCRDGVISIEEGYYNELSSACAESDLFKSPRGYCRKGHSQTFKTIRVQRLEEEKAPVDNAGTSTEDPIEHLIAEHVSVIKKLEEIEGHLKRRDVDALWVATAELENDLDLHSVKKEEEVLFPILRNLMPLAEELVTIIKEDHRELRSILHAFRNALIDNVILDGLAMSVATNLKSHIRKEDQEFFEYIDRSLDDGSRKKAIEGMREVERTHQPASPGDRVELARKDAAGRVKRENLDEQILAVKDLVNVDSCCHGG